MTTRFANHVIAANGFFGTIEDFKKLHGENLTWEYIPVVIDDFISYENYVLIM